jgi:hypothetical protein
MSAQLLAMGIQMHRTYKATSTEVNGMELSHQETTEFQLVLPRPTSIKARFSKEGVGKKLAKLFKKELQTGDAGFDAAIYIATDTPDATAAFLQSDEVRAAIRLAVETAGPIEIDGANVTIEVFGRQDGDDPQVTTIARALTQPASFSPTT